MKMNHPSWLCLAISAGLCSSAWATNGDQRIGLNATQAGMGGAIVAAPEDSAIVLVNPAGIAALGIDKMRFDMGFSLLNPPRSVNNVESDANWSFLPTGAATFKLSPRLYLGVGMSGISGFGMDVSDIAPPAPGNQVMITRREVLQFSPGMAYQLNDQLALGMTLNVYNPSLALSNAAFTLPQDRQFGFGATVGALYQVSPGFSLGFSYASKREMDEHQFNLASGKASLDMDGPAILQVGAAFAPMPGLTIEADIKHIFFSDVRDSVTLNSVAGSGLPPRLNFGWDDQTVFALGVRKQMGPTTLRLGLNYGASQIDENDVDSNLGAPAIVETHVSLGLSRQLTENLSGNFAYTHGFENELVSPRTGNRIKVEQNWFHFQLSYAF